MNQKSVSQVPNYLTALSPRGLRRQMLLNNVRLNAYIQYFDIQETTIRGKTRWIAWFYEDVNQNDPMLKEGSDESVDD